MTEWTEYAIEQRFNATAEWIAISSDVDADEIWHSLEARKYAASLFNDGLDRQYRVVERKCKVVESKDQLCNLPEGYYAVSWDDDGSYGGYYVRFGGYGPTWGWDVQDDPEMIPEGAAIYINGQKRYAREFRKEQV